MQQPAYRAASRTLLEQATLELDQGDPRQASEKGWGAAAQMVKAVAEQRGWRHYSHPSLYEIVDRLVKETGDTGLFNLFRTASHLHTNFYENWDTPDGVESGLRDVARLLDKLEPLLED